MTRPGDPAATGGVIDVEFPTTAGSLAVANLQAQIDGQQRQAVAGTARCQWSSRAHRTGRTARARPGLHRRLRMGGSAGRTAHARCPG